MPRFLHYLTEVIAWIQIVLSPVLFSCLIACFVYFPNQSNTRLVISILIILLGFLIGIYFASKIWKKQGTVSYLSKLSETPDIDKMNEK
jgi:hypothetical protein